MEVVGLVFQQQESVKSELVERLFIELSVVTVIKYILYQSHKVILTELRDHHQKPPQKYN